jgi:Na+-driven multidrug efflux pump
VIDEAKKIWPLFALMQPANGAVFALDGILIGASDTRYLMWAMLFSSFGVFVPITLASLEFDWGIVGVWFGLLGLILARLATLAWRFRGRRWARIGPSRVPA